MNDQITRIFPQVPVEKLLTAQIRLTLPPIHDETNQNNEQSFSFGVTSSINYRKNHANSPHN